MDEQVLGDGAADVMTRYGDRPGELQRVGEARDPIREGRDRARLQGELASRAPKPGEVDRDRTVAARPTP